MHLNELSISTVRVTLAVSILVLMDYAFKQTGVKELKGTLGVGFNPCFNGLCI